MEERGRGYGRNGAASGRRGREAGKYSARGEDKGTVEEVERREEQHS
jgi:hypothetical protein